VTDNKVGVLGAGSLVGSCVLSALKEKSYIPIAFSRKAKNNAQTNSTVWRQIPESASKNFDEISTIAHWICAAPIWTIPDHFQMLEAYGVSKLVALSSTSRFTKDQSTDQEEQETAKRLINAEFQVQHWAEQRGIEWVILRPTLIYGLGQDKNITEIVRIIRRFGFFPVFGKALGLRQPIHSEDVATACVSALQTSAANNRAYNISGSETLTYREMVTRVFTAIGRQPRLLNLPLWSFRLAVAVLRIIPRYRHWSTAMAERMNSDLVFEHADATQAFGFKPREFSLRTEDLS
jgi:nucleoside-diphosphate-sugar epimerase